MTMTAGLDRMAAAMEASTVGAKEHYGLHPKQRLTVDAMFARPQSVILAGGSGYGGKSYVLRFCAFYYAMWLAKAGFLGRKLWFGSLTYESLRDRHMAYFVQEYGQFGEVKSSDPQFGRCFRWDDRSMPVVCFRNLEDPNERRGSEFSGAFLDEATEITRDTFGQVLYQTRQPGVPHTPVVTATNPDGIGHAWCKALWRPDVVGSRWVEWLSLPESERTVGDNHPHAWAPPFGPSVDGREGLNRADYIFIPYLPDDNPTFDEDRFWRGVAHLPEHVRHARRFGLWDSPEGARWPGLREGDILIDVGSRWRAGVPEHFEYGISVDWGLRAPFCAGWWAIDPDTRDAYLLKVVYKTRVPTAEQIQIIKQGTANRRVDWFVGDPAMWQHAVDQVGAEMPSQADVYRLGVMGDPRFACGFEPGPRGLRSEKFATLDLYLARGNGWPDLYIDRSCIDAWSELTSAVWATGSDSAERREDIDPRCADHAITMMVYALHNREALRSQARSLTGDTDEARVQERERQKAIDAMWKRTRREW